MMESVFMYICVIIIVNQTHCFPSSFLVSSFLPVFDFSPFLSFLPVIPSIGLYIFTKKNS